MNFVAGVALLLLIIVACPSNAAAQNTDAAIAFGNRHAVALRTNGDVLTWGENVYCQLGRASRGNSGRAPVLVMRNAKEIAAASDHTLVLTTDGKVYGWGMNAEGPLGVGNTYDQCEGPALAESLSNLTVAHIATGYGFSVAVTSAGDLYCTGDNSVGQCPIGRSGRVDVFTKVPIPELSGNVAEVRSGAFHTLILTRDKKLYALGRGRDGQLGGGKAVNGFALVPDMPDVVSFAAGTWHSVAARADGSVWAWGNNSKSQLCDGATTNRAIPAKVALPAGVRVTHVTAGGHGTLMRTAEGALFGCGDNQFGPLGIAQAIAAQPTTISAPAAKSSVLALGGANGAISADGCVLHLAGSNDHGIVSPAEVPAVKAFAERANLSLCAARPATALATVVNPAPRGGVSNCWTTRLQEDASTSPRFGGLRQAMLAGEELLRKNEAFLAAPQPVRLRTSLSAGPSDEGGARMHIKAVPERKPDGTRLWTNGCEVIPQIDRIGGAIAQISMFFNQDARGQFIDPVSEPPKPTGSVAGYPEYNGWVLITKDKRLPWIPQTLADLLDAEGDRREKALAEARRRPGIVADSAAGGIQWLEKQVRDYQQYRASFTAEQLRAPGVSGDPTGEGRNRLQAEAAVLRKLSSSDQQQVDALGLEARTLGRQAQAETKNKNADEAAKLRARSNELGLKVREIQQAHLARIAPLIVDAIAMYDLKKLQPGPADRAIRAKRDPSFPDMTAPNRIQVIAVMFSFGPKPAGAQLDWQTKTMQAFDFAALAAMLQ
jgi:alpha-tubulin suppressor-like RCC1 family protein